MANILGKFCKHTKLRCWIKQHVWCNFEISIDSSYKHHLDKFPLYYYGPSVEESTRILPYVYTSGSVCMCLLECVFACGRLWIPYLDRVWTIGYTVPVFLRSVQLSV